LLHRSFFVTNEMSQQFRGQLMDGLLPVVLMLMARSGNVIDGLRMVSIDEAGKLVEIEKSPESRGPLPDGFQIRFHRDGETASRTLFFFRLDMGPKLQANSAFLRFLGGYENPRVLLKSASFLLHSANFAVMRDYILDHAQMVVQDDSGIPFRNFTARKWNVSLYGGYSRPLAPFTGKLQPDLEAAYANAPAVKEKSFSMGYGTGRRPTALLVARRPQ